MSKSRQPGSRVLVAGLAGFFAIAIACCLAHWIAPDRPNAQNLNERLMGPFTSGHILGTDSYGRDVLSRILYGGQSSLAVGIGGSLIGCSVGSCLGLVCGYVGGLIDLLLSRLFDILLAFPTILLALALVAALGPSRTDIVIAIATATTPTYGRVVRSAALSVRHREFITVSRASGGGQLHVIRRHIVPNVLSPIIVLLTVGIATAILIEATLSFLGLGAPPPAASWGSVISDGESYLADAPWISVSAGAVLFVTVLCLVVAGDRLRDILDPRTGVQAATAQLR